MIKKYITLAALLSAGTALANANTIAYNNKNWEVVGNPVKITTTFGNTANSSSPEGITTTVTVSGAGDAYNNAVRITDFTSTSGLNGSGEAAIKYSSIVPNINVGNSERSTLNFGYDFSGLNGYIFSLVANTQSIHTLKIDSVSLKLGATDINGNFLPFHKQNSYDFRVTFTPGDGQTPTTKGQQKNDVTGKGQGTLGYGTGPQDNPITFEFPVSQNQNLTPTATTKLSLQVGPWGSSTAGSIGIQSITFNASVLKEVQNVTPTPGPDTPEPSAFGLLAGLGALALVASRRRRK